MNDGKVKQGKIACRVGAAALFALTVPGAALASLSLCNQSYDVLNIAIAEPDGAEFTTSGWWRVAPNQCATLLRGPLERILERHGLSLSNNHIETLSTHLARAYIQLTDAIGVMGGGAAHRDVAQPLYLLPLALPRLLIRPAGVMWHKNRNLSPAARLMLSCLEETAVGIAGRADDEGNEVSRPLEGS